MGGGAYLTVDSTVSNCNFFNNRVDGDGGAALFADVNPFVFTSCKIYNNTCVGLLKVSNPKERALPVAALGNAGVHHTQVPAGNVDK